MHIKRIYLAITACVLILLICANVFQFLIWGGKVISVETDYKEQLKNLNNKIESIGSIVDAWTVVGQVTAGQKISMDDLKPLKSLQKSMGEAYIIDPEQIIGKFFKVSIIPGTPITIDLVMEENLMDSLRQYDLVADMIPIGLKVGDYIDYRLVMPGGEDYIALTHKRVEGLYGKTITLNLLQEEIHIYQSMLLDSFLQKGSYIYATKYVEPGLQAEAKTYYHINPNIAAVIKIDPNIIEMIKTKIVNGKRNTIAAEDSDFTAKIRKDIIAGRAFVQGNIDVANSAFWDVINGTIDENGTQGNADTVKTDEKGAAKSANQQPQIKQPARTITTDSTEPTNSAPTNSAPTNTTPTDTVPADTTPAEGTQQNNGSNDEGLNILEGIVQ